tara:strand:- start:678 stop:1160 length:483 start_codon:yes stop_codon:yes gene_type:complete
MWRKDNKKIDSLDKIPEGVIGFVYCITDLTTNKSYIGKKNLFHWKVVGVKRYNELKIEGVQVARHKNKKKSKKGSPVWVHKARMESDWLLYTGSNEELNKAIENGNTIEKEIWDFAVCEKQLTFLELEALIKMDVLREPDKFYNGNILGKFFPADVNCSK